MNKELRRVSVLVLLMFLALFTSSSIIQVFQQDELAANEAAQNAANNEQAALEGPVTASNTYEAPKEEEEVKEEVWTLPGDA